MFQPKRTNLVALAILALPLFTGMLQGCSSDSSSGSSDSDSQAQAALKWSLTLHSKCAEIVPEECPAGYGFTVTGDGKYRIGPAPQGQVLSGVLPQESFESFKALLEASVLNPGSGSGASADPTANEEKCDALTLDPLRPRAQSLSDGSIEISGLGRQGILLRVESSKRCYRWLSAEAAEKIQASIFKLATEHYPLPFPDDTCDEALGSLESLYTSLKRCDTDEQCTYLDTNFEPIAPDSLQFVLTGDCTPVKPMIVGNYDRVLDARSQLVEKSEHARLACKKRRSATGCTGFSRFQATQPAAICSEGLCKVHPQAGLF